MKSKNERVEVDRIHLDLNQRLASRGRVEEDRWESEEVQKHKVGS